MVRKLMLTCGLFLSSLGLADSPPDVISSSLVRIPYGQSQWQNTLQPVKQLNPLRLMYVQSPQCPGGFTVNVKVQYADEPNVWRDTSAPNNEGWVYHQGRPVSSVLVTFHQYRYQELFCQFKLEGIKY